MDWGSTIVGIFFGVLIAPPLWSLGRTMLATGDDEAAGIARG